jgi:hypothetical protein
VTVISSPPFTRANTFDVSWLSVRIDTHSHRQCTTSLFYTLPDGAAAARCHLPRESDVRLGAALPES